MSDKSQWDFSRMPKPEHPMAALAMIMSLTYDDNGFRKTANPDDIEYWVKAARLWIEQPDPAQQESAHKLLAFIGRFIESSRENGGSDIEGGDAQEWLLEAGLLEKRVVTEACGENCGCAEWDEFPQECNFLTDLGNKCVKAAREAGFL